MQISPEPRKVKKRRRRDKGDDHLMTAVRGGGINFVGKLYTYIVSLAFTFVMARYLGAGPYGLYKLGHFFAMIAGAICVAGLEGGIKRYIPIARNERNKNRIWGIIQIGVGIPFIIGLFVSLIAISSADYIANEIYSNPELGLILRLTATAIPFLVLGHTLAAVVVAFKEVKYDVYSRQFTFVTLKFVLSLLAIFYGYGVIGVTIAYLSTTMLIIPMMIYFVHRTFSIRRSWASADRNTGELVRFSLPLFFSLVLNQFGRKFEAFVLGFFGMMSDVGVYAVILTISDVGNMGYQSLRKIATPIFSELHNLKKFDELASFYQTISKWSTSFNLPIFLTVALFADNLLLIFGKDFAIGSTGMIVLAFGTMINAATGACGSLLNMSGHSKFATYNAIFYLLITLALDFLLIPDYGLMGAAWAGMLSSAILNVVRMYEVYFLVNRILPFNFSFWKPLAASTTAALIIYALAQFILVDHPVIQLIVLGPLLWGIYVGLILLLKLSPEDQVIVGKVFKRKKNKSKIKIAKNGKKNDNSTSGDNQP